MSMTILPLETPPPTSPRAQRHAPRPASRYQDYRPCLRWDAGFTCSFCLLHESDLSSTGVEGTGLTWIEHIQPQAHAPHLANEYANCAYTCRFCNNVRRDYPIEHTSGARLLHPWRDAWGAHFTLHDNRLEPLYGDARGNDARYTEHAYQLNDERKVELRSQRRAFIKGRIRILAMDSAELRLAAQRAAPAAERLALIRLACEVEESRQHAMTELRRRTVIPMDAPRACRCGSQEHHSLPAGMPGLEIR